jgi:hypothetical protein
MISTRETIHIRDLPSAATYTTRTRTWHPREYEVSLTSCPLVVAPAEMRLEVQEPYSELGTGANLTSRVAPTSIPRGALYRTVVLARAPRAPVRSSGSCATLTPVPGPTFVCNGLPVAERRSGASICAGIRAPVNSIHRESSGLAELGVFAPDRQVRSTTRHIVRSRVRRRRAPEGCPTAGTPSSEKSDSRPGERPARKPRPTPASQRALPVASGVPSTAVGRCSRRLSSSIITLEAIGGPKGLWSARTERGSAVLYIG